MQSARNVVIRRRARDRRWRCRRLHLHHMQLLDIRRGDYRLRDLPVMVPLALRGSEGRGRGGREGGMRFISTIAKFLGDIVIRSIGSL